jgi:hypothetical protein
LSISSNGKSAATDFDRWIATEFAKSGPFTVFAVLVEIAGSSVTPLCSTYFNVIGDEVDWAEITLLFVGAGRDWDGVAFFPRIDIGGGPLDNPNARTQLRELEERVDDDRLVLNEGHFFDKWGRRMKIEEVERQ